MLAEILDVVWPRRCEICGRAVDRPARHVCTDCLMRLPFLPTDGLCRVCGREAAGLKGDYLCTDCRGELKPHFDRAVASLRFEAEARDLILDFKFKRHLWLRNDFVDWLEASVRSRFRIDEIDAVLPMPSTLWHRLDRGYNPVGCLAEPLARRLGRPCLPRVLRRIGHPHRQSGLEEDERRANVKGTFAVRRPDLVQDRTLLVLDDIMTTGSTLSECARTLKSAGAKRVWCAALLHSIRDRV